VRTSHSRTAQHDLYCCWRYILVLLFFPAGVAFLYSMIISFPSYLSAPACYSERAKVSLSTPQPGDNPLLAVVNLLEAS
jgi:hypothetical protein